RFSRARRTMKESCEPRRVVGGFCCSAAPASSRRIFTVEQIADVAHGADERIELAELRAQPPHVHVDRSRATEVVVPPHLAQQLLAREDAVGMRREKPQQLELFVGEVERTTMHFCR